MRFRYYIDPKTELPHIYKHSVNEREAEEILAHPQEDGPGRDDTRISLGQTREGRYLLVAYVRDREQNSLFVITAYELRGARLRALRYRRRGRR